jgi:hypothetical protein
MHDISQNGIPVSMGHFIFQIAPQDFQLCRHISKYTKKILEFLSVAQMSLKS